VVGGFVAGVVVSGGFVVGGFVAGGFVAGGFVVGVVEVSGVVLKITTDRFDNIVPGRGFCSVTIPGIQLRLSSSTITASNEKVFKM